MIIKNCGYNVLFCEITTPITHGEATKIGTQADYQLVHDVAVKAGLVRGKMKLDGTDVEGTLILNPSAGSEDLIEFFTATAALDSGYVLIGQITQSSGDMYITINPYSFAS